MTTTAAPISAATARPRDHQPPSQAAPRRVRRAAAARRRRVAQEPQGVHPPHADPAVPARLRVHLRVPEDRQRADRRGRQHLRHDARRRGARPGDHVPGHPGRRPAARAGVRLHPRDRGPRPRPAAGQPGRLREGGAGRDPGADRRVARVPDRRGRPGRGGAPAHRLAGAADARPAGRDLLLEPRPVVRHEVRSPHRAAAVRHHRDPADVPRLHLLLVDRPDAGEDRRLQLAQVAGAGQPAGLRERGVPSGGHRPTTTCRSSPSTWR